MDVWLFHQIRTIQRKRHSGPGLGRHGASSVLSLWTREAHIGLCVQNFCWVPQCLEMIDWIIPHGVELSLWPPYPRAQTDMTWPKETIRNCLISTNYHVGSEGLTMNNKDTPTTQETPSVWWLPLKSLSKGQTRPLFRGQIPYYINVFSFLPHL